MRLTQDGHVVAGEVAQPYLRTNAFENGARFAPGQNQKWLAYQSDESGSHEIYVGSFPSRGEKVRVSMSGGDFPVWGDAGRELFYRSPDGNIMVVDIKFTPNGISDSPAQRLFPLPPSDSNVVSTFDTIDGQRFLILSSVSPNRPLQLIDNWPELLKN